MKIPLPGFCRSRYYICRGFVMQNEESLTPEEKWEKATLANNFIFYKVMRNHPEECKHLIELLLKVKIMSMEIKGEEIIDIDHDSKGIRLDVFVKEDDRMYDIEIQIVDTKELPERARYYQGVMDIDTLKAGQQYKDLRDSHIIFICLEDIFNNGLPINTFENICLEDLKTRLNDRAYKHFFIAPMCAKMIKDKEVREFFEFLISNSVENGYTSRLDEYVKDAKHNIRWRQEYMTYERIQAYAFDRGKEQGAQQKAVEAAVNLLKMNKLSPEEIAQAQGLPLEKVNELAVEIKG